MISSDKYTSLITSEHIDKPNFVAMVAAVCQPMVDIQNLCLQVPTLYDIETAIGSQLDVIGQWVGITRNLPVPITGVYFTLDTGPGLDGGILLGPDDPTTALYQLGDSFYRILIAAKILNNQWDGTKGSLFAITQALFSSFGYSLFTQDYSNLTMAIGLSGGVPPPIILAMLTNGLLDIRPATVHIISYITQVNSSPIFMLDAQPGNVNFAGLDNGAFANVITN